MNTINVPPVLSDFGIQYSLTDDSFCLDAMIVFTFLYAAVPEAGRLLPIVFEREVASVPGIVVLSASRNEKINLGEACLASLTLVAASNCDVALFIPSPATKLFNLKLAVPILSDTNEAEEILIGVAVPQG